jgi:hypothetical protein
MGMDEDGVRMPKAVDSTVSPLSTRPHPHRVDAPLKAIFQMDAFTVHIPKTLG